MLGSWESVPGPASVLGKLCTMPELGLTVLLPGCQSGLSWPHTSVGGTCLRWFRDPACSLPRSRRGCQRGLLAPGPSWHVWTGALRGTVALPPPGCLFCIAEAWAPGRSRPPRLSLAAHAVSAGGGSGRGACRQAWAPVPCCSRERWPQFRVQ